MGGATGMSRQLLFFIFGMVSNVSLQSMTSGLRFSSYTALLLLLFRGRVTIQRLDQQVHLAVALNASKIFLRLQRGTRRPARSHLRFRSPPRHPAQQAEHVANAVLDAVRARYPQSVYAGLVSSSTGADSSR